MTLALYSDAAGGGAILKEGPVVAIKVDATGNVTLPAGLLKQPLARRSFFSAFVNANFGTLTVDAWTAITTFWTEVVDSANAFTPTGANGGRFQPAVAGWYQINCGATIAGTAGIVAVADIWRNGAAHRRMGSTVMNSASVINATFSTGCAVYLNGTSDYVEMRVLTQMTGASVLGDTSGEYTWINGYLIEAD